MKFGVLQFFAWPNRRGELAVVYERALDRVKTMDQTGFDAVWLAEHHFSTYSVCPSVHVMAAHVAGITKNLRIGTAVSLAAFYHPLRLAEEVALLDNLTNGRINWGAGRGFDRKEMEIFGVKIDDSKELFHENVEIVLEAWRNEKFSYEGRYNQYNDVEVLPKPLQNPMPFWVAATSVDAIQWAAERGYAILMDPHASCDDIGEKYRHYHDTLTASGHENDQVTPMARLLAIADHEGQAEQIARNGSQWMFGSYFNQGTGGSTAADTAERRLNDYVNNTVIWGTPEQVADQLLELQESISLNYLLAAPLSHATFVKFVDEVMPRLA
ncbi:MAG: LLM class flavin-dependent oxidoreductase [Gammaproteobacteria bacterium]|nr:LLM class flavin-dependent oxidoreductase [Gammaproteobacteria bacterium]